MHTFFLGVLATELVSLIFFYILFRQRAVLLFLLYVILVSCGTFALRSHSGPLEGGHPSDQMLLLLGGFLLCMAVVVYSWFTRTLIDAAKQYPRYDRHFRRFEGFSTTVIMIILVMRGLDFPRTGTKLIYLVFYLVSVFMFFYMVIFLYRTGVLKYRIIAAGTFLMSIFFRFDVYHVLRGLPGWPTFMNAEIGLSIGFVMINFALIYGYWLTSQEKAKVELERQMDLMQQRKEIGNDLHDDIGSAFGSLAIYADMVERNLESDLPLAQRYMSKLHAGIKSTMDRMSDAIWAINNENVSDRLFSMRIKDLYFELFEASGIHAEYRVDAGLESRIKRMDVRKHLMSFVREAINNVIRHAHADKVILVLEQEDDMLRLAIEDNGKGIPETPRHGNGLSSLRSRTEKMGGRFQIRRLEKGTLVQCKVPIANISE